MEENYPNNYEIKFKDNIDERSLDIVKRYWSFDGAEFKERPGQISKDFGWTHNKLIPVLRENSAVLISSTCLHCEMSFATQVYSQNEFLSLLKDSFLCPSCDLLLQEKKEDFRIKEAQRIKEQLNLQLENAVNKRLWEQFNLAENVLLLKLIESNELKIDFEKLKKPRFKEEKELLERFTDQGLIFCFKKPNSSNYSFKFSNRLKHNIEKHISKLKKETSKKIPKDWSRISFKLLRNKTRKDKNTPLFSGTVEFKQDIVIKAGTKCLYGVWSREDENQWLTITPVSDIIVAKNKTIEYEAEPIRTILKRFLNNQDFIE